MKWNMSGLSRLITIDLVNKWIIPKIDLLIQKHLRIRKSYITPQCVLPRRISTPSSCNLSYTLKRLYCSVCAAQFVRINLQFNYLIRNHNTCFNLVVSVSFIYTFTLFCTETLTIYASKFNKSTCQSVHISEQHRLGTYTKWTDKKSYTSSSIDKKCRTKPAAKLTQKSAASITHICEIVILHTLRVRLIVWPPITTILRHHTIISSGVLHTTIPQSVVYKSGLRARR